jgi:hypothetical protein
MSDTKPMTASERAALDDARERLIRAATHAIDAALAPEDPCRSRDIDIRAAQLRLDAARAIYEMAKGE